MAKHAKFSKVSYEQFKSAITTCILNSNVTYNFKTTDKFIQSLYDNIKLPKRATSGSAGYDFYAPISIKLNPGEDIVIPTGIRCEMNENLALFIYPRSGLGFKNYMRLANSTGIIDSDYVLSDNEGHIMIKIRNESKDKTLIIDEGKGFAQGVFTAYYRTDDDETTETRNGGFGSTTK